MSMAVELMQIAADIGTPERVLFDSITRSRCRELDTDALIRDWDKVDSNLREWLSSDPVAGEHPSDPAEYTSHALYHAIRYGRTDLVVEHLNGQGPRTQVHLPTLSKLRTLHVAAGNGFHQIVSALLDLYKQHNPVEVSDLVNGLDSIDNTSVNQVSESEDSNCTLDNRYWTPLHLAARNGHAKVVEVLLKSGVQIDTKYSSLKELEYASPLHLAVKRDNYLGWHFYDFMRPLENPPTANQLAVVKLLLESEEGAKFLNRKDKDGNTALHLAIDEKNEAVVEVLLEQPRLLATLRNDLEKSPAHLLWDRSRREETNQTLKIIKKSLLELDDVKEEQDLLNNEMGRHYNAANNLLVVGALLATLTFAGVLSMPTLPTEFLTPHDTVAAPLMAPGATPAASATLSADAPPGDYVVADTLSRKDYYIRVIDIFRGSNNLSFFFAIVTVMASIRLIISPGTDMYLERELARLRSSTILISMSLTFSTALAVIAFISSGLAHIPLAESGWSYVILQWEEGRPEAILKSTMLTTNGLGLLLIIPFILIPLLKDCVYLVKDFYTKNFSSNDSVLSLSRLRPLLRVLLAVAFCLACGAIIFVLTSGVGLLKDYIKLPALSSERE